MPVKFQVTLNTICKHDININIGERRIYFRIRSRCRRRNLCLNSVMATVTTTRPSEICIYNEERNYFCAHSTPHTCVFLFWQLCLMSSAKQRREISKFEFLWVKRNTITFHHFNSTRFFLVKPVVFLPRQTSFMRSKVGRRRWTEVSMAENSLRLFCETRWEHNQW